MRVTPAQTPFRGMGGGFSLKKWQWCVGNRAAIEIKAEGEFWSIGTGWDGIS